MNTEEVNYGVKARNKNRKEIAKSKLAYIGGMMLDRNILEDIIERGYYERQQRNSFMAGGH